MSHPLLPYTTQSLHLAAYVVVATKAVPKLRLIARRKIEFTFEPQNSEQDLLIAESFMKFSAGQALVEPRTYQEAIVSLKKKIDAIILMAEQLS